MSIILGSDFEIIRFASVDEVFQINAEPGIIFAMAL
jgi:hypothetical protein